MYYFFANNEYDSIFKKFIGKSGYKLNSGGIGWMDEETDININEDFVETEWKRRNQYKY